MGSILRGKYLRAWLASLIVCLLLVPICFRWLDLPTAQHFRHNPGRIGAYGISSAILLTGEMLVAIILTLVRMVRGHLPEWGKALMIAIFTSIIAFTANNYVLKIIFGVPQPFDVLFLSAHHDFHFLAGSQASSFPSGHMALAGGFAGVWMRLRPSTIPALIALLATGMTLLVAGDWHFLSDVVAGAFLGVTAGLMAGALWLAHDAQRRS